MKQTVNFYTFEQAFTSSQYSNNFTYKGLKALFEYLEEYEEDCDQDIELDVCAICCEFTEYVNLQEFRDNYSEDYQSMADVENETTVIMIDGESFIIQNF
jgi:hypothetical protein